LRAIKPRAVIRNFLDIRVPDDGEPNTFPHPPPPMDAVERAAVLRAIDHARLLASFALQVPPSSRLYGRIMGDTLGENHPFVMRKTS
jgi:hypothetical protein